jgi:succinoglycan biosynthesis transport protein ExoP
MRYYTDLLDEGISAFPVRGSNIVQIRVRLTDARLSLMVANLCLKVLEERSGTIRNQSIANLERFVDDQVVRSADQLASSESDLTQFKESKGITSLEDDSHEMLKRLTEAEILYNATEAEVGSVRQRLEAVQEAIATQRKDLVPTVTSISGSSVQILRDKLIALESQQAQLSLQKYPEDHPEAVRLRNEIEQTKKALTEEAMKIAKANDVGDPIPRMEQRLEEAVSLRIELEGLEARAKALQQPVQRYRTWLDNLPEKELGLQRLERSRDANQKVYMSLLQRQEDVRIAAAKQIPGSRTIDRPLLPDQPIEPRKMLNLALGGVVGMILGPAWDS